MSMGSEQHGLHMFGITVHGTGHKGTISSQCQGSGIEGVVHTSHRGRLGDLILFRCRGILSLGQPVDLVVEHQYIDVQVTTEQMNGMVSPDTQAVTVTGHYPNAQFRAGGFQSGSNGCGPSVNGVHPECIHVIGETAAAADTGDKHDVFLRDSQAGHHFLYLGQDGIISASGTPAHFLVGGKIFGGQGRGCRYVAHSIIDSGKFNESGGGEERKKG